MWSSFSYYLKWKRNKLEIVISDHLKKLKEVNASLGLMLENSSSRLMDLPAHKKSPGKNPQLRIETISNAGKLKITLLT